MVSESFPIHELARMGVPSPSGSEGRVVPGGGRCDAGIMTPWDTRAETTSYVRGMSLPFSFGVPRPVGVHSDRNHFEMISSISKSQMGRWVASKTKCQGPSLMTQHVSHGGPYRGGS